MHRQFLIVSIGSVFCSIVNDDNTGGSDYRLVTITGMCSSMHDLPKVVFKIRKIMSKARGRPKLFSPPLRDKVFQEEHELGL